MKYFYLPLTLVILLSLAANAQSNYKPGYVIGLKGDTIKGYIDYREWSFNPGEISFKQARGDKQSRQLTADDINYFEVTGLEAYERYAGQVTMDATDLNRLSDTRDTSSKIMVVFLKVLQRGPRVNLLSYTDNMKARFFLQEPGQQASELIYRAYVGGVDNVYFRQLSVLADKYHMLDAGMVHDITHADYYKQNLLKIVSRINGISAADYAKKYDEPAKISFSASAAVNFSSINPYDHYKATGGKSSSSFFPAVSVGAGIYADPNVQSLEFIVQGIISGNHYQSSYIFTGSPYVPVKYSFSQVWFAIAPQVQYNLYNTPGTKVFAGFGVALTLHEYYSAKYDLDYAATKVTNADLSKSGILNSFTLPVMVKAGVRIGGKTELFAAYFTNSAAANDRYFQVNYNNIQLGLTYIIK